MLQLLSLQKRNVFVQLQGANSLWYCKWNSHALSLTNTKGASFDRLFFSISNVSVNNLNFTFAFWLVELLHETADFLDLGGSVRKYKTQTSCDTIAPHWCLGDYGKKVVIGPCNEFVQISHTFQTICRWFKYRMFSKLWSVFFHAEQKGVLFLLHQMWIKNFFRSVTWLKRNSTGACF